MKNLKTFNIILFTTCVLLLIIVIYSQLELFRCKESVRATRVLEKSVKFSHVAKLLLTYSRFREIVTIEEYMYCVLETEIKVLESGKYADFINTEIINKNLQAITDEQFLFNIDLIKQYLHANNKNQNCGFWGRENDI